jgi:hypothetical protein
VVAGLCVTPSGRASSRWAEPRYSWSTHRARVTRLFARTTRAAVFVDCSLELIDRWRSIRMRSLALLREARDGLIRCELVQHELQLFSAITYFAFFRVHAPAMGTAAHE